MITKNFLTLFILFALACTSNTNRSKEIDIEENNIFSNFIIDFKSLEQVDNPIENIQMFATENAAKTLELNIENVKEFLSEASEYNHVIIIVEKHTVVKITNIDDCKHSASWKACMPMAEGYIKKGELLYKNDYINNIIGKMDNQKRIVYFIN